MAQALRGVVFLLILIAVGVFIWVAEGWLILGVCASKKTLNRCFLE